MYNTKDDRSDHEAIRWTIDGAKDLFVTRRIWFAHQTWPTIRTIESVISSDLGIRTTIPTTCDVMTMMIKMAKDGLRSCYTPCKLSRAIKLTSSGIYRHT